MGIKMDGKALADKICLDLKARCDVLKSHNINPVLTIVTVVKIPQAKSMCGIK